MKVDKAFAYYGMYPMSFGYFLMTLMYLYGDDYSLACSICALSFLMFHLARKTLKYGMRHPACAPALWAIAGAYVVSGIDFTVNGIWQNTIIHSAAAYMWVGAARRAANAQ